MSDTTRIFGIWNSAADLAREIGQKPVTVRQWRRRSCIPHRHWQAIIAAAADRGRALSWHELADLKAA